MKNVGNVEKLIVIGVDSSVQYCQTRSENISSVRLNNPASVIKTRGWIIQSIDHFGITAGLTLMHAQYTSRGDQTRLPAK